MGNDAEPLAAARFDYRGRVVLVTGGVRGIGAGISRVLPAVRRDGDRGRADRHDAAAPSVDGAHGAGLTGPTCATPIRWTG